MINEAIKPTYNAKISQLFIVTEWKEWLYSESFCHTYNRF